MRVDAVVEAPPFLDHHPGLCHAEEHLLVEAFVPEPVVEALYMAVLPRASRIDVDRRDPHLPEPVLDVPGDELGTVVATDVVRHAPLGHGPRQGGEDVLALELTAHFDPEALPAVFVNEGQHLQGHSVISVVVHEVPTPHFVQPHCPCG